MVATASGRIWRIREWQDDPARAFYGWHHEKHVIQQTGYTLTAVNPAEGQRLHAAYLRLSQSLLPPATRYENRSFKFQINVRGVRFPAGTLVWHDYPGEWWNEEKQGEEGARKRRRFGRCCNRMLRSFCATPAG